MMTQLEAEADCTEGANPRGKRRCERLMFPEWRNSDAVHGIDDDPLFHKLADEITRLRAQLAAAEADKLAAMERVREAAAGKLAKAAQAEAEINNPHDAELLWHMEKRIRALTLADAQDALDAAIAKAVNAKLDAVAEYFTQIEKAYYEEATRPMPEHIRRMAAKMNGIARDAQNAILAMKDPE